jgi:hypothetical protein
MIMLQIIMVPTLLFLLIFTIIRYRKRQIRLWMFLFWLLIWASSIVVFFYPDLSAFIAQKLGIGRGADLALYISVMLLLYTSFRIFLRLEKIERHVTILIRQMAIERAIRDNEESVIKDREKPVA